MTSLPLAQTRCEEGVAGQWEGRGGGIQGCGEKKSSQRKNPEVLGPLRLSSFFIYFYLASMKWDTLYHRGISQVKRCVFGLGGELVVHLPWLVTLDLMIQQIHGDKGRGIPGKENGPARWGHGHGSEKGTSSKLSPREPCGPVDGGVQHQNVSVESVGPGI